VGVAECPTRKQFGECLDVTRPVDWLKQIGLNGRNTAIGRTAPCFEWNHQASAHQAIAPQAYPGWFRVIPKTPCTRRVLVRHLLLAVVSVVVGGCWFGVLPSFMNGARAGQSPSSIRSPLHRFHPDVAIIVG
jgi:hypothetical protein